MISCWNFSLFRSVLVDIDQLMRIMALTGTPSGELLAKLGSEEVLFLPRSILILFHVDKQSTY